MLKFTCIAHMLLCLGRREMRTPIEPGSVTDLLWQLPDAAKSLEKHTRHSAVCMSSFDEASGPELHGVEGQLVYPGCTSKVVAEGPAGAQHWWRIHTEPGLLVIAWSLVSEDLDYSANMYACFRVRPAA